MKNDNARRTRHEWIELMAAFERSGLSRREFAEREGIHRRTFAWWASNLTATKRRATKPREVPWFVPVRVSASELEAGSVVAPVASQSKSAPPIEVLLGNGRIVRWPMAQAGDSRLGLVLAIVEGSSAC